MNIIDAIRHYTAHHTPYTIHYTPYTTFCRISTNYNQYRQDMNIYHMFKQWRAITTTIIYKRLAFIQRLRTLHHHSLYRIIYNALHKNYMVMVWMRQLAHTHAQLMKKRCMDYLVSRYRCRGEVKQQIYKLIIHTIYTRHKYTLWCTWKVKGMGHTRRLLHTHLLKHAMTRWKNAYTARRYHRLVVYRKVMVMWKLHIHMHKVMACYLQYRRHTLFKVMVKYFIQPSHIHMRCAMMVWKMMGIANPPITLRGYVKLYMQSSHTHTR
ncbi:hypothetical protein EON63_23135 [archaeon]|nr:MAG: hypothetical protein EON63_23135 [archaeon]